MCVCTYPPVCVLVWPSPESLCLSSHYMAEKNRDQTRRGELHKWHSGARTPCFQSAVRQMLENRSEWGEVRDGEWETDCVCVCVLAWDRHFLFLAHTQHSHLFLYSIAACLIFWMDKRIYAGGNARDISLNVDSFTPVANASLSRVLALVWKGY